MTASLGDIKPTLWLWQTDNFAAELPCPSQRLKLCRWRVPRALCKGFHQTLQPAPFAALIRSNATRNIPWARAESSFRFRFAGPWKDVRETW
jgi:hypothetical protein